MSNFSNSFLFSDSTDTGNGHQAAQSCNLQCSFTESFQTDVAYIIVFARTTSKRPNLHLHSILICIHISILVPCNWIPTICTPGLLSLPVFSELVKFQTRALYLTTLVEQQQPLFAFSLGPCVTCHSKCHSDQP